MKMKRIATNSKSRSKKETSDVSGTNSSDDLTEAEKTVGVHILGKLDNERHFGKSKPVGPKKDKNKG